MKTNRRLPVHATDLQGATRLAVQGVSAITDVVENMHRNIARLSWPLGTVAPGRTRGITGLVYRSIRDITGLVGSTLDLALAQLQPLLETVTDEDGGAARDALVAVLNGVLGDHLADTRNPLAIQMALRRNGRPLPANADGGRVLLLIHGLCMNDVQWNRQGHDHGATLAQALGYQPIYLRYNSGLHVSVNGRQLAQQLEHWFQSTTTPVSELAILGFSMGGLLARSACHYAALAGHQWPQALKQIVFLGTPHFGAPMERGGSWLQLTAGRSPYSAPLAGLGKLRSAGITDLRHGSLLDEDWQGIDRFERETQLPQMVPLPAGLRYAALAATTGQRDGDLNDRLLGDGLVPISSALGRHKNPARALPIDPQRQWIGYGMNHLDLLNHVDVYAALQTFLAEPATDAD